MAKTIIYPLEKYFHKQAKADALWFELIATDAAFMHAAAVAAEAYSIGTGGKETAASTRQLLHHQSKALCLIQERLSVSPQTSIADATILAVLYLAFHAHFFLDYQIAKNHMEGLRKIVDVRGGLYTFKDNTKLVVELLK